MADNFSDLTKEIKFCRDCRNIFGFEPNPVFTGNENSKILQISQAPSQNVHNTSKCFNDASGRKLRNEWYKISDEDFYNDDNFYISGMGHCYPGKNSNGGDKKPPRYCADKWLWQEIKFVKSKIIILIGRYSAQYFFPKEEFSKLIFNNQEINGKLTIVLPHPSPLNQKWFKDHPEFETKRLPEIREIIHNTLYNNIKEEYDSKYLNNERYWGNKPHDLTVKSIQYLSSPSEVLDLGCGEGKDSFYLAKKGFNVTSVDISVVGINKLQNYSIKNKLKINAQILDINSFLKKCKDFDAIYCINILQFIKQKDIISTIDKIKSKTKSKGINVIASFISENSEQKNKIISMGKYYFDKEELKRLYKGWKIIFYLEKLGRWETHGEPKHRHFIVKMIAQKP